MSTQTIKWILGSRWCRALILVEPGLLAATNCPSPLNDRDRKGQGRDTGGVGG